MQSNVTVKHVSVSLKKKCNKIKGLGDRVKHFVTCFCFCFCFTPGSANCLTKILHLTTVRRDGRPVEIDLLFAGPGNFF